MYTSQADLAHPNKVKTNLEKMIQNLTKALFSVVKLTPKFHKMKFKVRFYG